MIVCGKYQLDQRLVGEQERYAATQIGGAERRVALTLVTSDATLGGRVQRASALTHQNLVRIFDLERDTDGRLWLVSELVSGPPLSLCVALTPKALSYVVASVLRGLSYAHQQGVWNGHITAEIIQLSWVGEVKLDGFAVRSAGDVASDLRSLGESLAPMFERVRGERVVAALAAGKYANAGQALQDLEGATGKRSAEDLRRALIPPRRTTRIWVFGIAALALAIGVFVGGAAAGRGANEQPDAATVSSQPMIHLDVSEPDAEPIVDAAIPIDTLDARKNQLVVDMGVLMPECSKMLDEYSIVSRCLLADPEHNGWPMLIQEKTSQILGSSDPVDQNRSCARERKEIRGWERLCVDNDLRWQTMIDELMQDAARAKDLLTRAGSTFDDASMVCKVVVLQLSRLEQCKEAFVSTYGGLQSFVARIATARPDLRHLLDRECRAAFEEVMAHNCRKSYELHQPLQPPQPPPYP